MRRPQILLSSLLQRPLLDPFPPGQYGRSPAVVDVGGGDVVERLVQPSVMVVGRSDSRGDRRSTGGRPQRQEI